MRIVPVMWAVYFGRTLVVLATLALVGAWMTQLTGEPLLGMTQQHLFSDATVLALLGIANFFDALLHARPSSVQAGSRDRN